MSGQTLSNNPEELWDRILSRQADLIQSAFAHLSPEEQSAVLIHLRRMSEEPRWLEEQRLSAQAALQALSTPLSPDL
jgi:hypothetical protein